MKISKTMLRSNLERVALGYLGRHDEPPDDLSEYDNTICNLGLAAEASGDLPYVKLALNYLLTTPGVRLTEYDGGQFPYSEVDLYDLFEYTWNQLWPDERLSAPGNAAEVELVEMTRAEWLAWRA